MNSNDYQRQARENVFYPDVGDNFLYPTLAQPSGAWDARR